MNIKTMGLVIAIWLTTISGALAQTTQSKPTAKTAMPAVIAVKFYADWCGSCKAMAVTYEEFQTKFDTQPVLHVVLDHTREYDRQQSAYLATSLGLSEVWRKYGNKTGFILLVNGKTKEIISTLTKEHSLKEMGTALQEAVNKVSSGL